MQKKHREDEEIQMTQEMEVLQTLSQKRMSDSIESSMADFTTNQMRGNRTPRVMVKKPRNFETAKKVPKSPDRSKVLVLEFAQFLTSYRSAFSWGRDLKRKHQEVTTTEEIHPSSYRNNETSPKVLKGKTRGKVNSFVGCYFSIWRENGEKRAKR